MERATFAAGCFWGVEAEFSKIPGVLSTRVGYTGGHNQKPTYKEVCSSTTGHAEAIEIKFDPKQVSYVQLLEKFFALHDPTTVNRQGPDVGNQYRSAIFAHSAEQEQVARKALQELETSGRYREKVVTEIVPAATFYEAEDYHQKYFEKQGR